jgi:hypothetical protein
MINQANLAIRMGRTASMPANGALIIISIGSHNCPALTTITIAAAIWGSLPAVQPGVCPQIRACITAAAMVPFVLCRNVQLGPIGSDLPDWSSFGR